MKWLWKALKHTKHCPPLPAQAEAIHLASAGDKLRLASFWEYERRCQERLLQKWQQTRAALAVSEEFDRPDQLVRLRQMVTINLEFLFLQERPDYHTFGSDEINEQRAQLLDVVCQHRYLLLTSLERKQAQLAVSEEHGLGDQKMLRQQIAALELAIKHL